MLKDQINSPEPSNLRKESVYHIAESVAAQLDFKPGSDIHAVIERLSGKIYYKDFWDASSDSGSLIVRGENDFDIFVAKDTSVARDRFTIAHELGHYVLHYLLPLKKEGIDRAVLKAERYGSDRTEWEANWFAAAFLMPEREFKKQATKLKKNYSALARQFGVSVSAAETRAKALS